MPLYDYSCTKTETCGRVFEHYLPLDRYKECPPCPDCGGETVRAFIPSGVTSSADAVVVFRASDGSYRFPGDGNGLSATHYEKQGLERVELKGWAQVRSFERQVNRQQYSEICRRMERVCERREAGERMRSSEVRRGLEQGFQIPELDDKGNRTGRMKTVRMSAIGRTIMERSVAQGQNRPRPKAYDPGFHVEAYAHDRGNRPESRDPQGRRRRD